MRFLIVGFNYLPESVSIGPYTADLAEYLQQLGHHVQVVAGFPIAPQWRVWDGYRSRWFIRETINGVPVLRTWAYVPSQPKRTINRILFDTSFALSSLLGGLAAGTADLIIVVSPPLQLGLTGWLLGLLKDAKFFFHIQDLVPDAAIATGMLDKNGVSAKIAHALESFVYQRAKSVSTICGGFAQNLTAKGVPPEKIVLLPNYIDTDFVRPEGRNNGFRQQHRIHPDELLVMYSGSIALKQGLHTLVESAAEFCPSDGVAFYLIGEGPYRQELETKAKELCLSHLYFLPLQPRETLPIQLSAADVLVITQRRAVTDVVFPGKLLYYMAAGRPILAAVSPDSETGRFVSSHAVGLVVPPEDPAALAEAIRFLRQNPHEAERLGKNGRRVAEERFDRKVVLKQFADHLETLGKRT
jgi:colanic acid biosynthesis glycosyl transferase WcaI